MWIFTNRAFLSIVADRDNKNNLLVRARAQGDIERVFGKNKKAEETPNGDYRFRISLPKDFVASIIAEALSDVKYDNFKNSVQETDRHYTYFEVWRAMVAFQALRWRDVEKKKPKASGLKQGFADRGAELI